MVMNPQIKTPDMQPKFNYQDAFKNYMDTINSNNLSNAWSQAQNQANYQANQQRSGYQNQLNLLTTNHDSSLKGVDTSLTNAKQDLQDNSFQKYLASRQLLANSGVSGTGLASDADTRLRLANNRSLAQLENNASQQRYAIDNAYNTQSQGLQQQINSIDPATIAQGLYNQYRAQSLQEQAQKAQQLYNAMNFQAQQDQNQWNRDRTENQDAYAKYLDSVNRQDKTDQFNKQFGLQEGQLTGYYNGNPTLNRENINYDNQMKLAQLIGDYNGQPTLAKQEMDANNAFKQQQLSQQYALAQQRASASAAKASSKAPSKSSMQSGLEDYFYNRYPDPSNRPTITQIEQDLRDNAGSLKQMGYDVNDAVDAAYKAYSQGQFPTKKAYDDYVSKLTKQREQYYKNNPPE